MTVTKKIEGNLATIALEGRLDTTTSPDLEKEISSLPDDVKKLVVDLAKLEYISSAGLRVLLSTHKVFSKKEGMIVTNVSTTIREVFDLTGFGDILTIK